MEEKITREQPFVVRNSIPPPPSPSPSPSSSLSFHKDSRSISKVVKPKIRIIHVFAPEIIKTDVANFRELVQRLTGNSSGSDHNRRGRKRKHAVTAATAINPRRDHPERKMMIAPERPTPRKAEQMNLLCKVESRERIVKEEEGGMMMMTRSSSEREGLMNCGGYLKDFVDLDGLTHELGGMQMPLFPVDASYTHFYA